LRSKISGLRASLRNTAVRPPASVNLQLSSSLRATPAVAAFGTRSCSSRFGARSVDNRVVPVRLPPGRFRLATRPSWTGSPPISKTMRIVVPIAFAASPDGSPPVAASTLTGRAASSAANFGKRSYWPRPTIFDADVLALDITRFVQPFAKRRHKMRKTIGGRRMHESDDWHLALRARRAAKPPHCRAAI
jgi:hypothetical protein